MNEEILNSIGKVYNKPRDVRRIPRILKKLNQLWSLCPDLRFLQLIYNFNRKYYGYVCIPNHGIYPNDTFDVEDDKFEQLIDREIKELKNAKRPKKPKG